MQASCVNEKNVVSCLEGMLFIHFFLCCSVVLCVCRPLIHSHFLQSYLLLCNWLFSRSETFLSKDSNVCSVVMDMLGIQLLTVSACCWCGCIYAGADSCSGQNDAHVYSAKHPAYTCRLVALEMIFLLGWLSLFRPPFFFFFSSVVCIVIHSHKTLVACLVTCKTLVALANLVFDHKN